MKRVALITATLILFSVLSAEAQDLSLTAQATPPPPWTPTQSVTVTLAIRNDGGVPAYADVDLLGVDVLGGLVDRLTFQSDPLTCYAPASCSGPDVDPPPFDVFYCVRTAVIDPGQSINCTFEVLAVPDANGADTGTFVIQPHLADGSPAANDPGANNVANVSFYYGVASAVSGLRGTAAVALVIALVLSAGFLPYRSR